ncbi:MAG: 3-phosphoglycerate dehydrogenase [Bacteroidetes bacterium]|nr:3-phosphoglycerate dehydrogenase [Bacteroidota bacterium]
MTKVLVATVKPFAAQAVNGIRQVCEKAGFEMTLLEKYGNQEDLEKAVADADALIIRSDKVTREVIEAGKNLKIVVRAGAGYDNVDLEAATAYNVVVMNTPGQNSNAVAELALGMMVYLARNGFNGTAGTELRGKKIGIHAFGHVGQLVGKIARGFGMLVYAFDPFIADEKIKDHGVVPMNSAEELYKECQFISLHIPANEKTKESINYELLSSMPEGATLVNTARKEVINEEDLKRIFQDREDFKYISDIAPDYAPEIESNYRGRFFFTPKKMGAQTAEANINAGIAAAEQIVAFLNDNDTTFKVN